METRVEYLDVSYFPQPINGHRYYYFPLNANLDRNPDGHPAINVLVTGDTTFLMLTAVWRMLDTTLASLRSELARQTGYPQPESIILDLVPVHSVKCNLLLGNGAGDFQSIATSSTSGVYPHTALFNLTLAPAGFAAVAAAAQGRSGFLVLEYTAIVKCPIGASGRLIAVDPMFLAWLRDFAGANLIGLRAAIEEALVDGLGVIELTIPSSNGQVLAALYDRILTEATKAVADTLAAHPDDKTLPTVFMVESSVALSLEQTIRPRVDLASLDLRLGHIDFSGVALPPIETEKAPEVTYPLRVGLGFEAKGAPLSWVRLQWGRSEAILKPPNFAPAEITGDPANQLVKVTTCYSDGSPTYKCDLLPPSDDILHLSPAMLGLVRVPIDARPLRDAGAQRAQVWLYGKTRHRPDALQHTIQFEGDLWLADWWLAVPMESKLSLLRYRWRAVTADGHMVNQSTEQADPTPITLTFQES